MERYREILSTRYLAERSYLYFQYPGRDASPEIYLPMLENIEIGESQKPNYATYDLIGRAGTLYAYLGSKSREFSLKFNITLPNIVEYVNCIGLSNMFSNGFRQPFKKLNATEKMKFYSDPKSKKTFFDKNTVNHSTEFDAYGLASRDFSKIKEFNSSITTNKSAQAENSLGTVGFLSNRSDVGDILSYFSNPGGVVFNSTTKEAVNYLIMWINVIRTSTVNNSEKTHLGPPTIYLNHGTMYNNVPCVCTNYSIKINTPVGYDLLSLTPRQVEITLNLSENRTGDFKNFVPFKFVESENLAGWEAIMTGPGTMDPNNQLLRLMNNDKEDDSNTKVLEKLKTVDTRAGLARRNEILSNRDLLDIIGD